MYASLSSPSSSVSPASKRGTSSSNDNNSNVNPDRKTHIEVCVRLRPLEINKLSSSSFFDGKNGKKSKNNQQHYGGGLAQPQQRKPPIPSQRTSGMSQPSRSRIVAPKGGKSSGSSGNTDATACGSVEEEGGSRYNDTSIYAWDVVSNDTVSQSENTDRVQGRTHMYTYDRVYGPSNTTKQVYEQSVQSLIHAAMEGYHSAVLAYGQTSTGKTFTMTGVPSSPGLIPLAIHDCFRYLRKATTTKQREYLLRVSYLEVYKEHIRDLLTDDTTVPIRLFDHKKDGLIIRGLKEQVVTSPQQIFDLLAQGERRRQIGATKMNEHSSRSHVMVRLWIESKTINTTNTPTNNNNNIHQVLRPSESNLSITSSASSDAGDAFFTKKAGHSVRVSSLSLVDLAGSESVKLNGVNETRRSEGHYINKSLMTLGQVVNALSEAANPKNNNHATSTHIPYRDSKLTRLLQPSLSGNAQMVLICCISPLVTHIEESHNTFKFASRAKKIPQKATIQHVHDEKTLLQTYRDEIEQLKQQLKEAKQQQQQLLLQQQQQQQQQKQQQKQTQQPNTTNTTTVAFADDEEIQELVEAISTMEHLILKTKPVSPLRVNHDNDLLLDDDDDDDDHDIHLTDNTNADTRHHDYNLQHQQQEEDEETLLLALADETATTVTAATATTTTTANSYTNATTTTSSVSTVSPPSTPPPRSNTYDSTDDDSNTNHNNNDLTTELHRIQGLLGSVMKKRKNVRAHKQEEQNQEVKHLRLQLERQEVATSLRTADSAFLQHQLEQKDDLLREVSKILEAMEKRQVQLETENTALKKQVQQLLSQQTQTQLNQQTPQQQQQQQQHQQNQQNQQNQTTLQNQQQQLQQPQQKQQQPAQLDKEQKVQQQTEQEKHQKEQQQTEQETQQKEQEQETQQKEQEQETQQKEQEQETQQNKQEQETQQKEQEQEPQQKEQEPQHKEQEPQQQYKEPEEQAFSYNMMNNPAASMTPSPKNSKMKSIATNLFEDADDDDDDDFDLLDGILS